jgi:teichoic acid transport system permease protein
MVSTRSTAPYRVRRAASYLRELWERREFAWYLAMGNLRARNASTAIGLFWWVLNPLLLGAVYYLVFGLLFSGRRPPGFIPYLLSGLFVFHFTHQSMTGGAHSILQNAKLLANLRFPRLILPISSLIESTVGFLASLVVLIPLAILLPGADPGPGLLLLPFVLAVHWVFNLGLGAMTARLAVPFRDITNFIPYLTRLWLYLSPVIWPLSFLENIDGGLRQAIELNPMFDLIGAYRAVLLGYPLDSGEVVVAILWAVAVGVIGVGSFVKYEGHMVRYL